MTDYPTCPTCRVSDVEVEMARDVRDPCPHCGGVLVESLRMCCLPDCHKAVPVTNPLPVCRDCGVKIALAHLSDAATYDVVMSQARRESEARDQERRAGKPGEPCVYYVRLDEERIKIGYTTNLKARMASLRLPPDRLLAIEPGGREVEKTRHAGFRSERIHPAREDFAPSPRIGEWIKSVRRRHGLPDWATEPDTKRIKLRRAT